MYKEYQDTNKRKKKEKQNRFTGVSFLFLKFKNQAMECNSDDNHKNC